MTRKLHEGGIGVRKKQADTVGAGPYVLLLRGPNGRPRTERFKDAAAYRLRLSTLQSSQSKAVSIEDIFDLLGI
jgi:hypothetical protein